MLRYLTRRHHRPSLRAVAVGAVVLAFVALSLGATAARGSGAPGPVIAAWRFAVAAAVWHGLATRSRRDGRRRGAGPGPSHIAWRLGTVPGVALGLNLACFFAGASRTPVAHAELLSAMAPVVVVPAGIWLLGERVPRGVVPAGIAALAGIALVLGASAVGAGAPTSASGDALVGCSVLAWAAYLSLVRRARREVPTTELMAVISTCAAITAAAIAAATSGLHRLVALPPRAWAVAVLLGLTAGVLAHGAITWANARVPVSTISLLQLAQPALGVVWAAVLLDQRVTAVQVVGIALVLAAVAAIARRTIGSHRPTRAENGR